MGTVLTNDYHWQNKILQKSTLAPIKKIKIVGTARQKKLALVYNQFGGLLTTLSHSLVLDLAVGLAVICVESSGEAFKGDKMMIRFEPHWFYKLWGKNNRAVFDRHFKLSNWKGETHFYREAAAKSRWQGFHGDQPKEWAVFTLARGLDENAAIKSTSMGLGQIMGFNHKQIGYGTAKEMFENFSKDARYQILGIFDFMSKAMIKSLQRADFIGFARAYNGSGQAKTYGRLIEGHVKEWEKVLGTARVAPTLRL
ncbi:MAG: DUF3380 domain-containing protein [Deltaproteobacteria bacterium]|nr:DUF3380 domain-containing protein [Deltaproteobacteria bacterium]